MKKPKSKLKSKVNSFNSKLLLFLLCFSLVAAAQAQTFYGTTDIKVFRDGRDREMRNREESSLKDEDFQTFKGLNYFSNDKNFRVKAKLTRTLDEKYFQMPTSSTSGKTKKFVKYGRLSFKLGGRTYALSVYQPDAALFEKFPAYRDLLFVPFKDLTNGRESYGGGRYMDIKKPAGDRGGEVVLDFNLAYNPNCAYGNDKFSCPIPPKENFLPVKIKAGETIFHYFGSQH